MISDVLCEELVGPHLGVLAHVADVAGEPDDFDLFLCGGTLANTSPLGGAEAPRACSGAGLIREDARQACVGEGVERYCAAFERPHRVVFGTTRDLDGDVVSPKQFALFSDAQHRAPISDFPFRKWTAEDLLGWVKARRLGGTKEAWVPAYSVQHPYQQRAEEPLVAPSFSTGLACGENREDATLRALCEVIERDAVALSWLGNVSAPHVSPADAVSSSDAGYIIAEAQQRGFRIALLNLTTSLGIPVAGVLLGGHSSVGNIVSFGASAGVTLSGALRKALIEAAHGRAYVRFLRRQQPGWRASRGFRNVSGFAEHALFHSVHSEHGAALNVWWNGPHVQPLAETPPMTLAEILHRLESHGLHAYAVEMTTPDVAELGLCVMRVVVPGLQPLHGNHLWPHLGGNRLQRLSTVFPGGVTANTSFPNRIPHPCP
ncbi:MAG: YcaO-like family protein [Candidatus Sumerlaeaceae bacterium]|nr:YcaO-like family protein [Candidatus Sumerlaeaceae bacterium]